MMDDITQGILLLVGSLCLGGVAYHFIYSWYKEREWRRNNPDEHKIMQKPVQEEKEVGGPKGPEPTRFKTWESKGREIDF